MTYVDGFVSPVPKNNKEEYRRMAAMAGPIFREHGALHIVECWGNDLPEGKVNDFRTAVLAQEGENVVFSWIIWPSKEVRDEGHKKVMNDPRMKDGAAEMPFDGKRLIYGGFEVLYDISVEQG